MAAARAMSSREEAVQASTWHKAWQMEDIQYVGWWVQKTVTHAGDHNVTGYSVEYEMAK